MNQQACVISARIEWVPSAKAAILFWLALEAPGENSEQFNPEQILESVLGG